MKRNVLYRSRRFCFRVGLLLIISIAASCANITVTTRSRTVQEAVSGEFRQSSQALSEIPLQSSEIEFAELMDRHNLLVQASRVLGSMEIWGVFAHELILTDPVNGYIRWRISNEVLQSTVEQIFYNKKILYISGIDSGNERQRLTALNREDGRILWHRNDPRNSRYFYIKEKQTIITAGGDRNGFTINALNSDTGMILWTQNRKASFAMDSSPTCGIIADGDKALIFGSFLLNISIADGQLYWEQKIISDDTILSEIYKTEYGILITQKRGYTLLDPQTGYKLWYDTILDARILTGTLAGNSVVAIYENPEGLSLRSIELETGKLNWEKPLSLSPRSRIITEGDKIYISDRTALSSFNLSDGELIRRRELPDFLHSEMGLPDHIFRRGDMIILAREYGIAAFTDDIIELLYARHIEGTGMYSYYIAGQRYLLRQVARSGQGEHFDHPGLIRELQTQLIRAERGSDTGTLQDAPRMVISSLKDFPLYIACRNQNVVSEGIAYMNEAVSRNMSINKREINAAVCCHELSVQEDYYIRPFYRDGWGITLIRLDDGARHDLKVSPEIEAYIINSGTFPYFAINRDSIIVNGFGSSRSERNMFTKMGYEKEVFEIWPGIPPNWHLPYSSLYTFSLEEMAFTTGYESLPSSPPVPGEKELQLRHAILQRNREEVRKALNGGADLNALDQLGWNALFYSAIIDDKKIAELLVDKGADATLRDPHQYLAYHYTFLTHGEDLSTLVYRSANLKQRDKLKK